MKIILLLLALMVGPAHAESILIIGDSISQGRELNPDGSYSVTTPANCGHPTHGYNADIAEETDHYVWDCSVGGYNTDSMLAEMDEAFIRHYDYMFLLAGANDSRKKTTEEYIANMRAMVDLALEDYPDIKIVISKVFYTRHDSARPTIDSYNEALQTLARKGRVFITDVPQEFLSEWPEYSFDLTHLTVEGDAVLADSFLEGMEHVASDREKIGAAMGAINRMLLF